MDALEVWKDIPGYVGLYQVSDKGRVRSIDTVKTVPSKNGKLYQVRKHGRVLSPGLTKANGYAFVNLHAQCGGKTKLVHRLVAQVFCSTPVGAAEVNHKDGDITNNVSSNLEWVTRLQNVRHCIDILGRQGKTCVPVVAVFTTGAVQRFASQVAAELALSGKRTGGVCWSIRTGRPIYGAHWSRGAA